MKSRKLAVGLSIVIATAASLAGCGGKGTASPDPTNAAKVKECNYGAIQTACVPSKGLHGDTLTPVSKEPTMSFTDTAGKPYNLITANPGKTVIVYFGYTHCPDLCPTIMADTSIAIHKLPKAVQSKIVLAFVSVDPHRDTLPVIKKWLSNFPPAIGLRAPIATVVAAQHMADVPTSTITHLKTGKVRYSVQHSAELLIYTGDHLAHEAYTDGPTLQQDLTHDLPLIMAKKAWR